YATETLADNPNARARCFASSFRVEAQYFLGQLPRDDRPIAQVVAECAALGEGITANFARAVQARLLAARGDRAAAIALLQDHMGAVEALGYPRLIAEFRSLLAELSLQEGNEDAAVGHAAKTVDQGGDVASTL